MREAPGASKSHKLDCEGATPSPATNPNQAMPVNPIANIGADNGGSPLGRDLFEGDVDAYANSFGKGLTIILHLPLKKERRGEEENAKVQVKNSPMLPVPMRLELRFPSIMKLLRMKKLLL